MKGTQRKIRRRSCSISILGCLMSRKQASASQGCKGGRAEKTTTTKTHLEIYIDGKGENDSDRRKNKRLKEKRKHKMANRKERRTEGKI